MLRTKNNDFQVGQWVRVNDTYGGPANDVKGVTSKIKGMNDNYFILEYRVGNTYGSTAPLVVKQSEVDKVISLKLEAHDKNGRKINVGDDIAYAVYGGELRLGRVLEIVPTFTQHYNYQLSDYVRKQGVYLSVEAKVNVSVYNSSYGTKDARYSTPYEATARRRVTNMDRVIVVTSAQKSIYSGISISTGANPLTLIN